MATDVEICNLALASIGDSANVASIDPPEASVQAQRCAQFYPVARDALLEMHAWGFATSRVSLNLIDNPSTQWAYCYARPSNALKLLSVLDPNAPDDYSAVLTAECSGYPPVSAGYTPQPYSAEVLEDGTRVIYTNQADATLRYVQAVTDTSRFSPLFVDALTWWLAGSLAGPIIKGDAGRKAALACRQTALTMLGQAAASDASQRETNIRQNVAWMAAR